RKHVEVINAVVQEALEEANTDIADIDAVAVTYGPGLVGALLVGLQYAKGLAYSLKKPLIGVNHIEGHISANFIQHKELEPPFVCLVVSGGHTFIVHMKGYGDFEVIGKTRDDAAGEAYDKVARSLGLGYPGGPAIDKLAKEGNPNAFTLNKPHIPGFNYSFSGLKTSFLYLLRDELKKDPDFIEKNKADLCATLQATVVDILMNKLRKATKEYGVKEVAVAGGVSANSGLRQAFEDHAVKYGWKIYIPKFAFTTDNAAMVAMAGYFKYQDKQFCGMDAAPYSRVEI
ncbi:MAG: tRNA (adenosine(37)-N6)-threonylcarbamoyltransferase complex transferase subunit TsaD, partial [Bacteroidota bacterium]|nr:tRNA (adenosine(37)-N6)-threonylcarbamoyltransferase complex transferase subunit TsaD [Bacteroidota bacterium]